MKAETTPEQRPNVVITISWWEAEVLRTMLGKITGNGTGRAFADELFVTLNNIGVEVVRSVNFTGSFQ